MTCPLLLHAVAALALVCPAAAAQPTLRSDPDYLIDTLEAEDGLPGNSVTGMVQDAIGYLWFGTNRGLVRWDGVEFLVFDTANTPVLADNSISALGLDPRGRMWVGTERGVAVYAGGIWRDVPLPGPGNGPGSRMVFSLTVGPDGEVLVTTLDGNVHLTRAGRFETLPSPAGTAQPCFGAVDEAGHWWVVHHRFIGKWDGSRWVETLPLSPDLADGSVVCGPARDGGLWLLTGSELRRIRQGVEVSRTPLPDFNGHSRALYEDSGGQVWISTFDSGLWRVHPGGAAVRHWTKGEGLASNRTNCTLEDREHNLWAGTALGGLMRFRVRTFHSYLTVADRTAPSHFSVAPHPDGGVLVAHFGRPLCRVDVSGITPYPLPSPATGVADLTRSLLVDRARRLWIATENSGVWVITGDTARRIPPEVAGGKTVKPLFEDSRGRIWMASGAAVAVIDNDVARGFGAVQGVPPGEVNAFAETNDGTLWIAHEQGLFRLNGERFEEVRDESGHSVKLIGVLGDAEGGMWIASANDGVGLWKDGRILQRPLPPEVPMRGLWNFADDGAGFLWISVSRGLLRIPLPELRAWLTDGLQPPSYQLFGVEDGLPGSGPGGPNQAAAVRDTRGRLWFPLHSGVAMADPASLHLNTVPPPVPVQSVFHYGASPDGYGSRDAGAASSDIRTSLTPPFSGTIVFPPGSRRLEISYAGLSFAAPERVRYETSLTRGNGRAAWQDAAGLRTAVYYDLPAGDYTFRVRASNNHGIWNESGTVIAFTVQPFYWQTGWFRTAGVLTLLALGGSLTWWIMRSRHARMAVKLELEEQRNEVAHLARVTTLGEISGSLAHELNQPLGAILANTEAAEFHLQSEHPNLDELREILADIRRDDIRAGEIIHGMRAFLRRRELQMQPLEVELLVMNAAKLIAGDAASRNITVGIQIEPRLPPVTGDHVHLQQVLINLMVNGMDAMNACPLADRHLTIHAARLDSGSVGITVTDGGAGISAGDLASVFKPFHTSKRGGLGLGLAICRSIMEAHGGQISLENNPVRGATARMSLPAKPEGK